MNRLKKEHDINSRSNSCSLTCKSEKSVFRQGVKVQEVQLPDIM